MKKFFPALIFPALIFIAFLLLMINFSQVKAPVEHPESQAVNDTSNETREFERLKLLFNACDTFENESLREHCYNDTLYNYLAIRNNDWHLCEKISYEELSESCTIKIALALNDSIPCNSLKKQYRRRQCTTKVAIALNDASPCTSLASKESRRDCYTKLALRKNDSAVCKNTVRYHNESLTNECIETVALALNNIAACYSIDYNFLLYASMPRTLTSCCSAMPIIRLPAELKNVEFSLSEPICQDLTYTTANLSANKTSCSQKNCLRLRACFDEKLREECSVEWGYSCSFESPTSNHSESYRLINYSNYNESRGDECALRVLTHKILFEEKSPSLNPRICEDMKTLAGKNSCLIYAARSNRNITICDKVVEELQETCREFYYTNLKVSVGDTYSLKHGSSEFDVKLKRVVFSAPLTMNNTVYLFTLFEIINAGNETENFYPSIYVIDNLGKKHSGLVVSIEQLEAKATTLKWSVIELPNDIENFGLYFDYFNLSNKLSYIKYEFNNPSRGYSEKRRILEISPDGKIAYTTAPQTSSDEDLFYLNFSDIKNGQTVTLVGIVKPSEVGCGNTTACSDAIFYTTGSLCITKYSCNSLLTLEGRNGQRVWLNELSYYEVNGTRVNASEFNYGEHDDELVQIIGITTAHYGCGTTGIETESGGIEDEGIAGVNVSFGIVDAPSEANFSFACEPLEAWKKYVVRGKIYFDYPYNPSCYGPVCEYDGYALVTLSVEEYDEFVE